MSTLSVVALARLLASQRSPKQIAELAAALQSLAQDAEAFEAAAFEAEAEGGL